MSQHDLAGMRALVTGASSGIGAAIARELAKRGAALVITARRQGALDALASELAGAWKVRVDVVVGDLGRAGAAAEVWTAATAGGAVDRSGSAGSRSAAEGQRGGSIEGSGSAGSRSAAEGQRGGSIDVLVNNAGFGYFRRFADAELARDAELLQLNVVSLVELSRRFVAARAGLPGRAYLLNIASIAAYQAVPQMAVYAASKSFVRDFTEALHDELRGTPVTATCVCPGGTHTEFHANAGAGDYGWLANASMLSADAVAEASVRAMLAGRRNLVPGVLNKLSCFGVRLVPRALASFLAARVMGKPKLALPPRTTP